MSAGIRRSTVDRVSAPLAVISGCSVLSVAARAGIFLSFSIYIALMPDTRGV
jgi:hypothetical protein